MVGGVSVDVTSRKEAEEALRESPVRLSVLLSATPAVIHTNNAHDFRTTFLSENVRAQTRL